MGERKVILYRVKSVVNYITGGGFLSS